MARRAMIGLNVDTIRSGSIVELFDMAASAVPCTAPRRGMAPTTRETGYADARRHESAGSIPDATAPALHVERVEASALGAYRTAWTDLCGRSIEPNIFLEPGFALPLLQHVARSRRPSFLLVWEENGSVSFGRLVGLFALHLGGWRSGLGTIARGFMHEQTTSGMPLVDRDRAVETLQAVLTWLEGRHGGRRAALLLGGIATDGPFQAAMETACRGSSCANGAGLSGARTWQVLSARRRAILRRPQTDGETLVVLASAKRRKEHARQSRRLSEMGRRVYASARAVTEVEAATERFLALEHRGWKGRGGTSLLADPALATFARTMTRVLAETGRCRIDAIEIDGRPVAMGIVLSAGDRAFFWKTCFDEAHGPLSPGVQLARELTLVQLRDPAVTMTDSCAVADHPMIDRLWPHRMTVADLMIAVAPGAAPRFLRWVRWERAARRLRLAIKETVVRLRRGRPANDELVLKPDGRAPMS